MININPHLQVNKCYKCGHYTITNYNIGKYPLCKSCAVDVSNDLQNLGFVKIKSIKLWSNGIIEPRVSELVLYLLLMVSNCLMAIALTVFIYDYGLVVWFIFLIILTGLIGSNILMYSLWKTQDEWRKD